MPRARSPDRERAYQLWRESGGNAQLKDIAEQLGLPASRIRKWKAEDKWEEHREGALLNAKGSAPKRSPGAPPGNKNAAGNRGGPGGPTGNKKAEVHGFFAKVLPADAEMLEILEHVAERTPLDILWDNIQLQYMVIIRAQKLMYVKDQDDRTRVLKRVKESSGKAKSLEVEYELQHAWDKHATLLVAQSRAMTELRGLIKQYDELLRSGMATEEQHLRIAKLKAEVGKMAPPDDDSNLPSLAEALQESARLVAEKRGK